MMKRQKKDKKSKGFVFFPINFPSFFPSSHELTWLSIFLGIAIGVVMTAANVYLALYAGTTISASIPAAVIASAFFSFLKKKNVLQINIVQTIASSGESLAGGVIFTIPALIITGAWNDFAFWPTTLIAIAGGLLGILFMIPLRKAFVVKNKTLTYPEGVACASIIKSTAESSNSEGFKNILRGVGLGALIKLLVNGFQLLTSTLENTWFIGTHRLIYAGLDMSPALLAVGFIVNFEVACSLLLGGIVIWVFALPIFFSAPESITSLNSVGYIWDLWEQKIRYIGVGSMLVGGVWSLIVIRKEMAQACKMFVRGKESKEESLRENCAAGFSQEPTVKGNQLRSFPLDPSLLHSEDMSPSSIKILLGICFLMVLWVYNSMLDSFGLSLFTSFLMIVLAFPVVAVTSYICGLVGSSNSPVSGIVICVLLVTAAFFIMLGLKGNSAILATLGIASVICCAAASSADCSQDLKTGYLLNASPKAQQWAEVIGLVIPAFIVSPILSLLHHAYGIGVKLLAPQATLFASITKALFGSGSLPWDMILVGCLLGVIILLADAFLKSKNKKLGISLMCFALGIYLPFSLVVTCFIGGLIRFLVERKRSSEAGILLSSGLIAGESLMGILLAVFITLNLDISVQWFSLDVKMWVSSLFFIGFLCFFIREANYKAKRL